MTARKLNPEEASLFAEALQPDEAPPLEDQALIKKLSTQRDAALILSPKLGDWFGVELAARFEY